MSCPTALASIHPFSGSVLMFGGSNLHIKKIIITELACVGIGVFNIECQRIHTHRKFRCCLVE